MSPGFYKALGLLRSPRILAALLFFFLSCGLQIWGLQEYQKSSASRPITAPEVGKAQDALTSKELQERFFPDLQCEDYELISRRNLFHSSRKPLEQIPEQRDQPKRSEEERAGPQLDKEDFKLYGTSLGPGYSLALLYYQGWPEQSRLRLLREGEAVRQDPAGRKLLFRLVRVEPWAVVLQDSAGRSLKLSLYVQDPQDKEFETKISSPN